jgi:hypothetical protein
VNARIFRGLIHPVIVQRIESLLISLSTWRHALSPARLAPPAGVARSGSASSKPRGGVATRACAVPRGAIVAAGCCLLEDAGDHVRVTRPEGAGFRAAMLARVDYDRHWDEGTLVE